MFATWIRVSAGLAADSGAVKTAAARHIQELAARMATGEWPSWDPRTAWLQNRVEIYRAGKANARHEPIASHDELRRAAYRNRDALGAVPSLHLLEKPSGVPNDVALDADGSPLPGGGWPPTGPTANAVWLRPKAVDSDWKGPWKLDHTPTDGAQTGQSDRFVVPGAHADPVYAVPDGLRASARRRVREYYANNGRPSNPVTPGRPTAPPSIQTPDGWDPHANAAAHEERRLAARAEAQERRAAAAIADQRVDGPPGTPPTATADTATPSEMVNAGTPPRDRTTPLIINSAIFGAGALGTLGVGSLVYRAYQNNKPWWDR